MSKKRYIFYILVVFLSALEGLIFHLQSAYGVTVGQPTFNLYADYCRTPSVPDVNCTTNCPDPGDVITITTNITNNTSDALLPLHVIFRVEGPNINNQLVDLFFGGATYMNTHQWGGINWDDSFDEVVNTPEIPPGGSYTAKANFSVLRQQLNNIFKLGNGASKTLTVRVEVFSTGFITYYGTNTAQLKVTNRKLGPQGCGGPTVTQNAAPVMLLTNTTLYTPEDDIYVEWSILAASDETGGSATPLPTWGDTQNGVVDIIQLDGLPSGDPETDCADACGGTANCGTASCTNLIKSISTWTRNYINSCSLPCSVTDEGHPLPNTFYYSYRDSSTGTNTFTNLTSFPASELEANKYYLVRMRSICLDGYPCGTLSHTIRGPQWTYFKIGQPTLAVISSFNAFNDNGRVVVEWETSNEINTIGFYLLRLNETDGSYEVVNKKLLPGIIGSRYGGIYRLVDEEAQPGQIYTYKLLEIESRGTKITHGPFKVKVSGVTTSLSIPLSSTFSINAYEMSNEDKARIIAGNETQSKARLLKEMNKGNQIKIPVTEDGLYYIDASEVAALMGKNLQETTNMIKNNLLVLSNMGQEVAYLPAKKYKGIFFYGEGLESVYTRENIYYLYYGKGLQMEHTGSRGKGPHPSQGYETFNETLHIEKDLIEAPELFSDPDADYWFWDYIFSGYPDMDRKTFTVTVNGVANTNSTVTLTAYLQGVTDTDASLDHHVIVSINGFVIGEDQWDGANPHELVMLFSQNLLIEGDNTIEVQGVLDAGVPYSVFLIDSFDINYERLYRAVNNTLLCRGDGNPVVSISGFTNPDILVLDITDPLRPKANKATTIDGTYGDYRVSFTPASPDTPYLTLSSDVIYSNIDMWANTPSLLLSSSNRADYLIITASGLKDSAQLLAAYRKGKGLETMVVELEDIMDEFNYGIFNPEAIRDFLSYAYNNWIKAPRYVVLVGEGTYDYRDNLSYGGNLLPPMMVSTPFGLFSSDNYLADINGDFIPEMAVGRLPVVTAGELNTYISKLNAYESASGGTWEKKILMLSDKPDIAGNFPSDSNEVALLLPAGHTVEKIYLSELALGTARQKLFEQINTGALLLNYIGHSSVDRLSNMGLLLSSDVESLNNGGKMPVVTAMTCFMNNFAYPGYDSLGELLSIKDNGGAVAVWGPTGLSLNPQAVVLDKKLFSAVFLNGKKILGDAILEALREYKKSDSKTFMLDIYNLLGDPALTMR